MANNTEVTVQIFSGGFNGESVSFDIVEQKLLSVLDRLPVTKVIMGWLPDKKLYEKTSKLLKKRDIGFYLWFPVFSETGALKDLEPLVDLNGNRLERIEENKSEDFFFCCPDNKENIKKILEIFTENFSSLEKNCFNGVFLDKIRYPSFANSRGSRGVYSCFCPECLASYKKFNFNAEKFKLALSGERHFDIAEYSGNGKYLFKDAVLSDFFKIKLEIIYESLSFICDFFRERKYGIGFDVFAPFLAPFTGQDVIRLSSLCDFIKPMMYRVTNAPAGLPFETDALTRHTGNKIINKNMYNLDFCVKEIKKLNDVSSCPVYAGIEINRVDDITPVTPFYIEETISAYLKEGIHRFALSWNLLDMPDDNIEKAAQTLC